MNTIVYFNVFKDRKNGSLLNKLLLIKTIHSKHFIAQQQATLISPRIIVHGCGA